MRVSQIVVDTNILVAAACSRQGASYKLLSLIDGEKFKLNVSVPLIIEYEEVLKRDKRKSGLSAADIDSLLDYLCLVANQHEIFYLWRPFLRDPKDDMVLELAVESGSDFIVTYNKRDFQGVGQFGIEVVTPREFLGIIGELK